MLIYDVAKEFQKEKIPYAVVGGLALAFHGIVRATLDVDLIIQLSHKYLEKTEKALNNLGLTSRIPVRAKDISSFREEYIEKKNLIAWSFVDFKNPMRQVDILITLSLEDISYETIKIGGHKIPVAKLEDLAKMKKKANRPQDLIDLDKIYEKIKSKKEK